MIKRLPNLLLLCGCLLSAVGTQAQAARVTLAEKLVILKDTYPTVVTDIRGSAIILPDGRAVAADDGEKKSHQDKLKRADIEDQLSQVYPLGRCVTGSPKRNFDPGRIRDEAFMKRLFGGSKKEVAKSTTHVSWFGKRIAFTNRHGAADALKRVHEGLAKLPRKFRTFLHPSGGTFNWRVIAGTDRLSVHSFAAAIDINTKYTDYWRWAGGKPGRVPKYKNRIPREIVDVFERHGFIWGGKWYHYDTMHFEYRPEMIAIGRLAESRGC